MDASSEMYVIGVTGHRYLLPDLVPGLKTRISAFFDLQKQQYGAENITVLSPLAEGADMLCAKLALDRGLRLVVPLPLPKLEYRMDFSSAATAEFDYLLSLADNVFVVRAEEPSVGSSSKGFCYRQTGIYLAKHCDILLALWDGVRLDTPDGAGTWETIKLAERFGKQLWHLAV